MKAQTQKITMTVLLAGIALFMTACSNPTATSSTFDFASRAPVTSDTTTTTPTSGTTYVATCNYRTNGTLTARLKMFIDSATNSYRMDMVQVRMNAIPAGFSTNSSYFGFWKWSAASGATTQNLAKEALKFAVYDSATGKYLTDFSTTLIWDNISGAAKNLGISTPEAFFNRVTLIVNLKNASDNYAIEEYDALKIVSYNTSTQTVNNSMDMLLPPFAANPNEYATESSGAVRATILQNLHPLAAYKSQGYSSKDLATMTTNFCF